MSTWQEKARRFGERYSMSFEEFKECIDQPSMTEERAKRILEDISKSWPELDEWWERVKEQA